MKSHKHRPYFWCRAVSVALCVVLLSANMMEVSAAEELMRDEPLIEEERQSAESVSPGADATEGLLESSNVDGQEETDTLPNIEEQPETVGAEMCKHHMEHDETCGYTEGNPVCSFICPICPVEEQIDAVLALLEKTEELDEEGMLSLSEQAIAAKQAYERMAREEQTQIDADKIDKLLAFVENLNVQTLEDGDSAVDGMKIATAEIRADGMSNQALSDGITFTIDFSKQFTLHIEVESKLNLANKKVEITVPDGLTVVEYPIPERGDMAESVTPESIDQLHSVNNYGGYHPTNGTITYSLKNTAEKNSFNIVLAPDTVLWNRTKEQSLTEKLTIRVYTDDTDGQIYQTISATPKITGKYNDTPGDNRAIQTGPRLSRVGVKTGVPTAANQPFALRQIWINPDKDYIDMPQFFKKLEITIALPYYTKNGSKIYAKFDHVTYDPAGQSTRPNLLDPENHKGADDSYKDEFTFTQTTNETDHTVTLTWENLYMEYGQDYFTPYFKWTADCEDTTTDAVKWGSNSILNTGMTSPGCYEGKTPTTGAASAVGGTITWQNGSTWYLYNGNCTMFNFTARAGESMEVKGNNAPAIYNAHDSDASIVYYLGQFHVVNHGGAASADKTVEFTYGNNDKIGVTAQKIPATTGNAVEVWYTTTKNSSEQKYNGTLTSSGGFVTFTAQMARLGEDEYFTKIKANVGRYEKDYVGYVSSRDQDPTSGYATTFGKLLAADAATYTNFASMKMYNTGSADSMATTVYYTVKVTTTRGEIPLAMEQAYKEGTLERVPILSKTSATAGETITFNGLLSSSAYPYSSNNITTDPEIYIRLPEKITVENLKLYQEEGRTADKVFLLDAVVETVKSPQRTEIPETAYEFEAVTSAETGYKLYKITFTSQDNPAKVGWFTDGLGQYQIGISFDMKIAKDADAMTLDMRDCVRFKSASLTSTSNNGTLAQYQVMDDGMRYSTFNVNAKGTKLSVVAARLGLTFTFGARMTEKGSEAEFDATKYSNFEVDKNTVYLKDANHVVDMLFTLKNETGRAFSKEDAQAFYYFIPVPETGDLWDSHMQDQPFEFHMSLTRAPELQGTSKDHILVTYATEIESTAAAGTDKHYSNTARYKTEEQLLAGCTSDEQKAERWRKVKMIRIAAKPDITSIPKNAELKVNMRLEPMFNENADLVGSEINFGPCGVSPYSVGNTPNQGHNPLPRIQVEFQTGVIGGKIFIDKNFNGTYEEDTDELYTGSVTVEANHSNGNENCTEGDAAHKTTASNGNFKFTGRRADTYHVTVPNPGSTDANAENPLRFSLPENLKEGEVKFSADEGGNNATATVVLDINQKENDNITAQNLMIGLQQPHTVTFEAENAVIAGGASTKVWHGARLGNVVPTVTADKEYRFVGWKVGNKIYDPGKKDDLAALKELQIDQDTTIKAEVKKLYTVSYDLNGGTGAGLPESTSHIAGETVKPDNTGTENLTKGENTIFVGWSQNEVIENPLAADASQDDINKIISSDDFRMPAANVVLRAVYAVDENRNNNPDYNDNAVHVRYHGNNNVREDVICLHHHVVGADAQLSASGTVSGRSLKHADPASAASSEVKDYTFTYKDKDTGHDNIFIGWSTQPILGDVIKTSERYEELRGSIVKTVTMLDKQKEGDAENGLYADEDGNTNVYAVWAADANNNQTADYTEECHLIYNDNKRDANATVENVPTDSNIYLPDKDHKITLIKNPKPAHSPVGGKAVAFVGWTTTKKDVVYGRNDDVRDLAETVTFFEKGNKTVYAAWGYDENGNGEADVLEKKYSLTYDGNAQLSGQVETLPAGSKDRISGDQIDLTGKPTHSDVDNKKVVFIGWTKEATSDIFSKEDTKPDTVSKVAFADTDVTVYAAWGYDTNKNGTADVLETKYTLTYAENAVSDTVTNMPSVSTNHINDEEVNLEGTPIHSNVQKDGKETAVAFIGWTEAATDQIYSRTDTAPKTVEKVTFADKDITVYAAWGYDENNNDIADALETFYSLTYDGNGNTGGTVPETTWHIVEEKVLPDYTDTNKLKKGNAIFAGWSLSKINEVLQEDAAKETIEKIITSDEYIMPANHVILYAVYAIDGNQNGSPDFNDDAVHVRYHGNNNVSEDVICPHHHVAGATAKLSANGKVYGKKLAHDAPASAAGESIENYTFTYGDNIFIGWSTTPILNQVIASKAEYETLKDSIKTEVKLLAKPGPDVSAEEAKDTGKYADADGNTNVYAVWAADRNKNKTADYLEEHGLAYADNAISGNVTGMPAASVGHISKDTVKLTGKPGHSEVDNKKVAFIGWTATATDKIYSCTDEAPEMITEVTFADADITVYAAWGYDENNNGTADVLETYSLTYDLNGGSGNVPAVQSGIKKGAQVPLTMEKDFTRNDKEVFAGWSYTKNESAFTADQEADVYEILITDTEIVMEPKDITLYAVWAVDQDDDGKPDYSAIYTVTYNLNGGSGDADYGQETVKRGVLHKVREAPSREGFEFLCWKDDDGTEHQPGEQVTVTGNLTLTAQWKENDPAPEPDTGNLTVSTTVAGNAADAQKEFHFTVTLGDTTVNGVYGNMEFTEGVSTFTLKHSESKTATGLPAGITYEVAETEADQDGYVTSKTGDTGTIEKDVTSTAAFTNTKNVAPVDPNKPTSPENPVEPDKPTNPENPVEPDKPANPENPVEPDKPSNPENPDKPINPGNPVEPDKPAEPKKPTDDVPKTGDETNLALWLALLGIPGIGVIAALLGSKRKYRGKHSKR